MSQKAVRPFGDWSSPVRPEMLGLARRLDDVQWGGGGRLVWLEGRSGKGVLVCRRDEDAPQDITETHSVRAGVGYGGGDFCSAQDFVVFAEKNGRLFRAPFDCGEAFPITPEFGHAASPAVSPDGRFVVFVHTYERKDRLAVVDSEGKQWPRILVEGADFYMQPVWHPSGGQIAWVEWNHPHMPWDATILKTALWNGMDAGLGVPTILLEGKDTTASQPAFSPDGRWLSCIAGEGEWENLILFDLSSGKRKTLVEGGVLADPAWVQGTRTHGWSADSRTIFLRKNEGGYAKLCAAGVADGGIRQIDIRPYTWIHQLAPDPAGESIAFLGSSPAIPSRVLRWEKGKIRVLARATAERLPAEDIAAPEPLAWKNESGEEIHGLYYPPQNPKYEGRGLPPAVLHVHGGPNSQRVAAFHAESAFFTSRGYAFLSVNYRGSTGYGRRYRCALCGRWGDLDVEDTVSGARMLCERNLADPARLVIHGGSAGGYTVLNALVRHPGFFRAGVCLFGVSDLFALAAETHKFEERYLDSMVGPLPEAAQKYRDWSPLFHAEQIRDPLAVFQGAEDVVVPPNQSERIVESLQRRNIPCHYRAFPGEGHGWRRAETIIAYYAEMEQFLRKHVLYA